MENFDQVPQEAIKQIKEHGHDQPLRNWAIGHMQEMIEGSHKGELSTACFIERFEELAEKMKATVKYFDYHEAKTN